MIEKWYEVTCDYCGAAVNHYPGVKPTRKELENDGLVVFKDKVFCDQECLDSWKRENRLGIYKPL